MRSSYLNDTGKSFQNTTLNTTRLTNMTGPRLPVTTPPIRQIIQVHDKIKYNYYIKSRQEQAIEQQKRIHRIINQNGQNTYSRNQILLRESEILDDLEVIELSELRVKRDPTPTQPIRSLHLVKKNLIIPPEQVETRSASALRQRANARKPIRHSSTSRIPQQRKSNPSNNFESNGVIKSRKVAWQTQRSISPRKHQHEEIVEWLSSLGVEFFENQNISTREPTEQEIIESLKTGTKFAEIIEKLESTIIRGIERKPVRTGAIVNNLNRVLEVLRSRKHMNPRYLWSNREIMQGDPEVIWGLLQDMQQDYTRNVKKKMNTSRMNTSYDTVNISRAKESKVRSKSPIRMNVNQDYYHSAQEYNDYDPYHYPPTSTHR
jgi:hypothetical protein